jgi:hypothetical protein
MVIDRQVLQLLVLLVEVDIAVEVHIHHTPIIILHHIQMEVGLHLVVVELSEVQNLDGQEVRLQFIIH